MQIVVTIEKLKLNHLDDRKMNIMRFNLDFLEDESFKSSAMSESSKE